MHMGSQKHHFISIISFVKREQRKEQSRTYYKFWGKNDVDIYVYVSDLLGIYCYSFHFSKTEDR